MKGVLARPRGSRLLALGLTYLVLLVVSPLGLTQSQAQSPFSALEFVEAAPQGFGDRQNSYSWSMVWWQGKLYVGTGRSTQCVQQATGHLYYPIFVSYPPLDPDIECTDSPQDLPLQAEIWRWTPETDNWERVYQSPNDVEIPGHPGQYVARDIGFRTMAVFREPDGTEALYVGGASSNTFNLGVPPARILRSTDGVHFEPVPQDPGTFLGDTSAASFRSLTVYNGRLYVIASLGYAGFGHVLEAENPAGGNDNFGPALPAEITAFELKTYNGFLYIGTGANAFAWPPDSDAAPPFSVLRTDASGTPPYATTAVITDGGFRRVLKSRSVVSMHVFEDSLYVGTDRPAELLRVNPDDSWDLIVGTPRFTPLGFKYPLSGMDVGFDNSNNIHIWRMQTYHDQLYVGTMDQSTKWRTVPFLDRILRPIMGFDLYASSDGEHFAMLTNTGFDDIFDVGVRNFAVTPHGLVFGTANQYYGTKVWRETAGSGEGPGGSLTVYLPILFRNGASVAGYLPEYGDSYSVFRERQVGRRLSASPEHLEVTSTSGDAVLSWQYTSGALRFHVFRADFISNRQLRLPDLEPDAWIPGPFVAIGTTHQRFFVDTTTQSDQVYHYYVLAEDAGGMRSGPSNLVRFPSLALVSGVSFRSGSDGPENRSGHAQPVP